MSPPFRWTRISRRSLAGGLAARLWILIAVMAALEPAGATKSFMARARRSVVKIYVTRQRANYSAPWESGRLGRGTGTGFVIDGRRILTNGHVVSDARFIQVQKDGDPRRYEARVAHMGYDCDLAILAVDDAAFYEDVVPLELADDLPELNDEVVVLGYPLGGQQLSITRGVVSRIDYSVYAFSGVDEHLAMQVDAAINPGNSGGPVFFGESVVGVSFQGIDRAQSIGYTIPLPVVNRFLNDIESGTYDGFPELGVAYLELQNPALREDLGLPAQKTGVALSYIDPFGSANGHLQEQDVLLAVADRNIANDGNIMMNEHAVTFLEIIERKQRSESVEFDVWRTGEKIRIDIPMDTPHDPFVYRNLYDRRPRYYILGGLIFSPLNREYLKQVGTRHDPAAVLLRYYAQYAKVDGLHEGVEEFTVLIGRLPHPVNTYADRYVNGIVHKLNGERIARLADLEKAARTPQDGFHIVEFVGLDHKLLMDAATVDAAAAAILQSYSVPSASYLGEKP